MNPLTRPKGALEGNLVKKIVPFQHWQNVFVGKRSHVHHDPRKTAEGQNGSDQFPFRKLKGPKIHNSFLAYKTRGFVRWQKKNPPNRTPSPADPKSVQKNAHYLNPIEGLRPCEPKKAKYATF